MDDDILVLYINPSSLQEKEASICYMSNQGVADDK